MATNYGLWNSATNNIANTGPALLAQILGAKRQREKNAMEDRMREAQIAEIEGRPAEKLREREERRLDRAALLGIKERDKGGAYANQFRDEFNQNAKEFRTVANVYKNIASAATSKTPSAATDMSLIFSYMKMLDPTSTVREGEYATAQNAASVPERVRNQWNKMKDGDFLQSEQRMNFAREAQEVFKNRYGMFKQDMDRYTDLSKRKEIDPRDVVFDYGEGMGNELFNAQAENATPGAPAAPNQKAPLKTKSGIPFEEFP